MTRLQRLALLYPADGERVNSLELAPWDVGDAAAGNSGRLTIVPKRAGVSKREAAIQHVDLVRRIRGDRRHVLAYSDGSHMDGLTGSGVAVFHGGQQVTSASLGLGDAADVYDAELYGLQQAARRALPYAAGIPCVDFTHVHFFADNDSSIQVITKRRPAAGQHFSREFMRWVGEFLGQDERHRVSVEWVPGHEDVAGQEATDELAKAGTRRTSSAPFALSLTRARRNITTRLSERWIARWNSETRRNSYAPANRIRPSLRPTEQLRSLDKSTLARLTQCRSGHAHTGEYYRMISKPERGLACCCGAALQTRDHILAECPRYERYRNVLRNVSPELSTTQLLGTREGIRATSTFLRRSGAFGRPTTDVGVEEEHE